MIIFQAIGEILLFLLFLFNIGIWVWNGFWLPRYVHWIALAAALLGSVTSYEIVLLGNSVVSVLWVPFLGAGIVYAVFILHGAGLPKDKTKKGTDIDKGVDE